MHKALVRAAPKTLNRRNAGPKGECHCLERLLLATKKDARRASLRSDDSLVGRSSGFRSIVPAVHPAVSSGSGTAGQLS